MILGGNSRRLYFPGKNSRDPYGSLNLGEILGIYGNLLHLLESIDCRIIE